MMGAPATGLGRRVRAVVGAGYRVVVASDRIQQLFDRYEHDSLAQLLLVVEQLEVARELLRTESLADARAGLILLDHHAEILLHHHCESLFRAGDGKGPFVGRAYKQRE